MKRIWRLPVSKHVENVIDLVVVAVAFFGFWVSFLVLTTYLASISTVPFGEMTLQTVAPAVFMVWFMWACKSVVHQIAEVRNPKRTRRS